MSGGKDKKRGRLVQEHSLRLAKIFCEPPRLNVRASKGMGCRLGVEELGLENGGVTPKTTVRSDHKVLMSGSLHLWWPDPAGSLKCEKWSVLPAFSHPKAFHWVEV